MTLVAVACAISVESILLLDHLVGSGSDAGVSWATGITAALAQPIAFSIQTASTAGGPATVLYSGLRGPALAQPSEGWLYWSEGPTPGQVRRAAIAGGGPIEVLAANLSMPRLQFVDGDRVWWLASTGPMGEVRSAPLDGGESVLELATASWIQRILIDDANIYLSTLNGVWRLPK